MTPEVITTKSGLTATLYCADCLEILPTLGRVDAVVIDPPYGIGESSRKNATRGKPFGKRDGKNTRGTAIPPNDYGAYDWDQAPATQEHLTACIGAGDKAVIWGGNYFGLPAASKWLVWDKERSGDFADAELAWTNLPGAVRLFKHMWNGMLRASERDTQRVHPTQKPVCLMQWCLQEADVQPEQTVLDGYMGSGTTGVAALRMGCNFIGIEISDKYYAIAKRRIQAEAAQGKLFQ